MEVLLRSNSLEAREAMKTNTFLKEGKKYVLLLRNVIMKDDQEFIKWEAIEEEKFQKPSFMKSFFISLRAISLTAVFTPCLAIYLFGQYSGYTANSTFNWLSTIGVIFALLAVNVFNDVSDHYKLIDLPENVGGSGVIQKGWISARQLRTIGIVFLTIGFAIGTYLLSQVNGIEIFILLGFVGAIGYSASTWGLKYHALGDLAVLLFCGPVLTIGHSLVTFGEVIPGSTSIGLFFGFLANGILHANNIEDIHVDKGRKVTTLATVLGLKSSKNVYYAFYLFAYLSIFSTVFIANAKLVTVLLPLLSLPIILPVIKKVSTAQSSKDEHIRGIRFSSAQFHLITGILFCLGVYLARFF